MIATLALEVHHLSESVGTGRFSQRVALIKNFAVINEEQDPHLVIQDLKTQVQNLKDELNVYQKRKTHVPPQT